MVSSEQFLPLPPAGANPKLLFFGVPHSEFAPVITAVERLRPEAIALLGDIQARRPLHLELQAIRELTQIWFIHGNHDTDSDADYDHVWGSELADRNMHGRIVESAGYRVAGLGGVFRSKIWDPRPPIEECAFVSGKTMRQSMRPAERWRDGIARRHRSTIFPDDYQELLRSRSADILVTHEAPAAHPHGWQAIDGPAKMLGVRLLVHGHRHEDIDYVSQGLMGANAPFRAFGVDKGSHLSWPLEERGSP